jgi:hypothetical protein
MGNCSSTKQTQQVKPVETSFINNTVSIKLRSNQNYGTTYPDFIVRFNFMNAYINYAIQINNSIDLLYYKRSVAKRQKKINQANLFNNDIDRLEHEIINIRMSVDNYLFSDFYNFISNTSINGLVNNNNRDDMFNLFVIANILLNFNEYELFLEFLNWTKDTKFLILYTNHSEITPLVLDKLLRDKTENNACVKAIETIYHYIASDKKDEWRIKYSSIMAQVEEKILTNNNLVLSR